MSTSYLIGSRVDFVVGIVKLDHPLLYVSGIDANAFIKVVIPTIGGSHKGVDLQHIVDGVELVECEVIHFRVLCIFCLNRHSVNLGIHHIQPGRPQTEFKRLGSCLILSQQQVSEVVKCLTIEACDFVSQQFNSGHCVFFVVYGLL